MLTRSIGARPRPFFEAPSDPSTPRRRLVLISFAFPPVQSPGTLRWEKLSHYVVERGWALDVIMADPAEVASADYSRLDGLPAGTRIYGVRMRTPAVQMLEQAARRWIRLLKPRNGKNSGDGARRASTSGTRRPDSIHRDEVSWKSGQVRGIVRAWLAWSRNARFRRWACDAAALTCRLVDPAVHEAIITSAPPHMLHEAGRLVSRRTRLPFIMDMRDPWSLAQRLSERVASPLWLRLAERYERRAVTQAALVVANTEPLRRAMCEAYPEAAARIITVTNGYDEEPISVSTSGHQFVVSYAGSIYHGRDPRPLFRAAAQVVRELNLRSSDFSLQFIGAIDDSRSASVEELARAEGIGDFVTSAPPRSRRDAMEFLAQATMLVSLDRDNGLTIPGKVFEYMRFEAWMLVMAEPGSAPDLLLRGSGVDIVDPDDVSGMAAILRNRYQEHSQGVRPARIASNERFSRRFQAGILMDAVEACLGTRASAGRPGISRAATFSQHA